MKFRFRFTIINHLMRMFMLLMVLLLAMAFGLVWFFRMDVTAHGNGVVRSAKWVDVKPEVKGIIRSISVREGQKVKMGQVLFILEDRERKVEVAACMLRISELTGNIVKLKEKLKIAEGEITGAILEAKYSLAETKATYRIIKKGPKPEEIAIAKNTIERAKISLEKNKSYYKRMKRAHALELISQLKLDVAYHDMMLAEKDLALAIGKMALLRNKYDSDQVSKAMAEVDRRMAILGKVLSRKHELNIMEHDLITAHRAQVKEEKQLAVLKEHLKLTRVAAPIDGFVLTHDTEHLEGKAVMEGEVVIRLGDMDEYIVDCKIPEMEFALLRVGQEARVSIKPFPKGEYKLFKARVQTLGTDVKTQGFPAKLGMMDKLSGFLNTATNMQEGYYPVCLTLEKPYTMHLFGNQYEIKPGFSAAVDIIIEQERIATFLLRRVLRIKGKLTPEKIHL